MSLKEYGKKRKFTKTPEPKGQKKETGKARFVVQRHQASHLHYDFRLELEGVLKSWAVPKGPPTEIGEKRLAVAVEDHPVDYIDFEGTIPEGEYGAGEVKIWDKGGYVLEKRQGDRFEFTLRGKKLKGRYVLVLMKARGPNNWLIIKRE
jgi:bifunctional non-homologous end joining protein LigD